MTVSCYYVLCNVESGSVLELSADVLETGGYPVICKCIEGELPDPLTHAWDRTLMTYFRKPISSLSHIQFRKLFTQYEELSMDTFNDTYQEMSQLSDLQKAMVRTGLKKYMEAASIDLQDVGVSSLLDLYISVGVLEEHRKAEIISGHIKQT